MENYTSHFLEEDDLVLPAAPAVSAQPVLNSAEMASLAWNKAVKEILAGSSFNALKHSDADRPKKANTLGG